LHHSRYADEKDSILAIDDRDLPFEYDTNHSRVKQYYGVDVSSQAVVAWAFSKTRDTNLLIEFYRELVRNCTALGVGISLELQAEMHLNSQFKDSLLANGNMFKRVHIIPNNARGKYM